MLSSGGRRGPAACRNLAAQEAVGDLLFFVDSDVVVRPDVFARARETFEREPDLVAVFGSYDERPAAAGVVSRYRNLLHHFVHQNGQREAATFWAGCGVVDRLSFLAQGGFDETRYPRPSIEDIELGYRLRRAGGRIALDRDMQCTHLKRWTLHSMLVTDVTCRALPWARLLREPANRTVDLNLSRGEQACAGLALAFWLSLLLAPLAWFGRPASLLAPPLLLLAAVVARRRFFRLVLRTNGIGHAIAAVFLHQLYYLSASLTYLYSRLDTQNPDRPVADPEAPSHPRTRVPWVPCILLLFGAAQSLLLFGHQQVPNADFPLFFRLGESLWDLEVPAEFRKAPLVGVLQVGLHRLIPGIDPLRAGWLLNAVLHPFNLVLLWMLARRFVGSAAGLLAIVVAINSWVLQLLVQPLAETTLTFFTLATFVSALSGSTSTFFFAACASLTRYDGAALILVALAAHWMRNCGARQRLVALGKAGLAGVPITLWMVGTWLRREQATETHYLETAGVMGGEETIAGTLAMLVKVSWLVAFKPLLMLSSRTGDGWGDPVLTAAQWLSVIALCAGVLFAFVRRRRELTLLSLYALPYSLFLLFFWVVPRYCAALAWINLLLALYGIRCGLEPLRRRCGSPGTVLTSLAVASLAGVWLSRRDEALAHAAGMSPGTWLMPWLAIGAALGIIVVEEFTSGRRRASSQSAGAGRRAAVVLRPVAGLVLLSAIAVSHQFSVAQLLKDGRKRVELKQLGSWITDSTVPGQTLLTKEPALVGVFAPDRVADLRHVSSVKGASLHKFFENCARRRIEHVAIHTRIHGTEPPRVRFKAAQVSAILKNPARIPDYEPVLEILTKEHHSRINVFRLIDPDAER